MSDPRAVDPSLPPGLPEGPAGAVVTIGMFDGVHRGHRLVLREIVRRAEATGRRSVLVSFHPHPLRIVRPEAAPRLLTSAPEKKELLAESGLEYVVFVPFTPALRQYSARRFVEEILLSRIHMRELVVGYDHGFGRDRQGGIETMRRLGGELGFDVDVVDAEQLDGEPISSTRIRRALQGGDVDTAGRALGRPYSLRGPVVRGAGRGRGLGFPTANIAVADPEKLLPREGVYAVCGRVGGRSVPGLLHLGPRPTFGGTQPTVEVHLLDFDEDLYGRELMIDFHTRLRDVRPFSSADDLVAQLRRDEAAGRRALAESGCQNGRTRL